MSQACIFFLFYKLKENSKKYKPKHLSLNYNKYVLSLNTLKLLLIDKYTIDSNNMKYGGSSTAYIPNNEYI